MPTYKLNYRKSLTICWEVVKGQKDLRLSGLQTTLRVIGIISQANLRLLNAFLHSQSEKQIYFETLDLLLLLRQKL